MRGLRSVRARIESFGSAKYNMTYLRYTFRFRISLGLIAPSTSPIWRSPFVLKINNWSTESRTRSLRVSQGSSCLRESGDLAIGEAHLAKSTFEHFRVFSNRQERRRPPVFDRLSVLQRGSAREAPAEGKCARKFSALVPLMRRDAQIARVIIDFPRGQTNRS